MTSDGISVTSETTTVAADRASTLFNEILSLDIHSNTTTVTVCLASINKNDSIPSFERLQMSEKLTKGFRDIVSTILKQYQKNVNADDTLFPEFFIESTPEEYEIEMLDLTAYNTILEQINPLKSLVDIEIFAEDKHFVEGLRFYVIVVQPENGDPVYFFRAHTPKKVLSQSFLLAMQRNDGNYDRVEEPLLLFDEQIDCMSRSGVMFIIDKKSFESIFRFFEKIRTTVRETLNIININVPIENFEEFVEACEGNLPMMRKLKKIEVKPYIKNIKMGDVRKVIERLKLPVKTVEINGQEKLLFDPKAKAREKYAILRVLNDDYLKSDMTNQNYEVNGKREL